MKNMRRAAAAFCISALVMGACSSKKPMGTTNLNGGGPFGNAPSLTGGGSAGIKGSGSTIGSTGTGTGSGTTAGGSTCAEAHAEASRVVPRVVLLVDGSCSMSSNYPNDGTEANNCSRNPNSRWAAIQNALVGQTGVVTQLQASVEFGLAVFGTRPTCPIPGTPVQPALNNLTPISAGLPQTQPGMFTPTGAALDWTYQNMFTAVAVGPDQQISGSQILILATDGEPNDCMLAGGGASTNFQPSIDAVTRGAMAGVKTYVVSVAASSGQFHDFLQQIANIGSLQNNGKLYEPATPQDLAADLGMLVGGAIGCDVSLNGSILKGEECKGTVTLSVSGGSMTVPCNDPNGWIVPDPRHIRLQGTACDKLKSNASAIVDARFPCDIYHVG